MQAVVSLNLLIPSMTFVIPAYNEEGRIGGVLDEVTNFILNNSAKCNVIVSIDGNDGTEEIVREYSKRHNFVSYISNEERGGKGAAIKRVVNQSTGEFTMIMDADGSVKFSSILKNIDLTKEYDLMLFDRYSGSGNRIPLRRRIPSRGFNVLVRVILGVKVNDTQCGYKIIRTDLLKSAFKSVAVTNTFFDVALLYYLKRMGARIKEVEVEYTHDDQSKFNVVSEIIGQGISLIAFRIRHSRFYKHVPEWAANLYTRKFRWI